MRLSAGQNCESINFSLSLRVSFSLSLSSLIVQSSFCIVLKQRGGNDDEAKINCGCGGHVMWSSAAVHLHLGSRGTWPATQSKIPTLCAHPCLRVAMGQAVAVSVSLSLSSLSCSRPESVAAICFSWHASPTELANRVANFCRRANSLNSN